MLMQEFIQIIGDDKNLIDLADGLNRLRNNKRLYKMVLGEILKEPYMELVNNNIKEGNIEEAAKNAHALKGVTANLSLKKAYEISAALEQKLKADEYDQELHNELVSVLADTKVCVEKVVEHIDELEI